MPKASSSDVPVDPLTAAPKVTIALTRTQAAKTPIVKTITTANVRKASLT